MSHIFGASNLNILFNEASENSRLERQTRSFVRCLKDLSLLVVDDHADLREIMVFYLKKEIGEVCQAASGQEALQIVLARSFDAVLSDVEMPNGNGIELLGEIKKIKPDLPVFLITGNPLVAQELVNHPQASAVFEKPPDYKALFKALALACGADQGTQEISHAS